VLGISLAASAATAAFANSRSPFALIGRFSVKYRYAIVVAWVVVTVLSVRSLPSLSSVSNNNNSAFLPKNVPSLQAAALAAPFEHATVPTALLVASRASGPLTGADQQTITRIEGAVQRIAGVSTVRDQGISGDGQARKASVAISPKSFGGSESTALVDAIRHAIATVPVAAGLSVHLTGEWCGRELAELFMNIKRIAETTRLS